MTIGGPRVGATILLMSVGLMGCAPVVGKPSPPLTTDPNTGCGEPREMLPEELESYPGCDLEGFTVRVGEVGGAVVPTAGESVAFEAIGSDGESSEFEMTNFGEDGVFLKVHSGEGAEVWGPSTAHDRHAEDTGT
jgi:hypothetical protein